MSGEPNGKPLPTFYIPHGGGPCFFMDWTMGPPDTWHKMGAWLGGLGATVGAKPKALLVVSAHWEEEAFTAGSAANPPLVYDYYGFPPHTYQLRWDAPGSPALAEKVRSLLDAAGLPARTDSERGYDHGVFVPFKVIYPNADIPTVQLSLRAGLDPTEHIAAGRALEPLRREGVLIVGSGMSYHNMRGFGRATQDSEIFDAWLTDAATQTNAEARNDRLIHWESAPAARRVHPREEHLLPLMVAAGAAGADSGSRIFTDHVMAVQVSGYEFGAAV